MLNVNACLTSKINEMTALGANLAAVSIAIFLVMPLFRAAISSEGRRVFFGFRQSRRLFFGFTALAAASVLFIFNVLLGIVGRHLPTQALLLAQEALCSAGLVLLVIAVAVVWAVIKWGD